MSANALSCPTGLKCTRPVQFLALPTSNRDRAAADPVRWIRREAVPTSFHMKHSFLLILLAEPLSGNNAFLSAWTYQTSDRKTVGHNYPVCSEARRFLLFKSQRGRESAERRPPPRHTHTHSTPLFSRYAALVSVNAAR